MVLKPSKEFLQEALTNNSFDIDMTDKALRIGLDHAFSYLYRLQRNTICYEEYFYTTRNVVDNPDYGDLYLDARERVCVNLPASLILQQYREKFRTSKYYRELVDYDVLKTDHTLFARLPLITIDNQVVRSFTMDLYDDFFTAHLPFGRYFVRTTEWDKERKEYGFVSHNISLQVINNAFYQDVTTNSSMLKRNSYSLASFDRILATYAKDLGLKLDQEKKGTFFAVIFKGDDVLGSQLQEVSFDESGDIVIHYDQSTYDDLMAYTGNVTIRFYFYRYLYRYTSYHYTDGSYDVDKMVKCRTKDNSPMSELFLIQKAGNVNYQMPIPTENLLVFKDTDGTSEERPGTMMHFPNTNVTINYPNIYRITKEVESTSRFTIFYFYVPPYDLGYEYMYQFFYNYLQYKWTDYSLEDTINRIFFGDTVYSDSSDVTELNEITTAVQNLSKKAKSSEEGLTKAEQFAKIFDFVINHEVIDYTYDEMDYIKNYQDTLHPFEYKVMKLKSFIKDDANVLLKYVRAQNKVGYKYEFSAKDVNLPSRYCTQSENGEKFSEPMYLFTIQRPDPDETLAARIFVDGFLCTSFIYDRYEYTDLLYVPATMVSENSYFEVEVFPRYMEYKTMTFDINHRSYEFEFPSTDEIAPTMSDIFFFLGEDKDTLDRLDPTKFLLEYVDSRYSYYVNPEETITIIYKASNHKANKGPYWDRYGQAYTYEGIRTPENDVTTDDLIIGLKNGTMSEDEGYETDNHYTIERLENPIVFEKVTGGETTLQPNEKGLLYSRITKVRVTLQDISLFDQPITLGIAKKPAFEGSKLTTVSYPYYLTPLENIQNIEEYTRAFKNGRLLSKNRYDYTTMDGYLAIQMLERVNPGESVAFDVMPYRSRLIYYNHKLDSDLVSLKGYIDKPFDAKFYEVYLNGRRLNRSNIYPISAYEIKLAGIHSLYNLEIYEKDRDWEYYGTDFDNYFTLSDFLDSLFMEDEIAEKLIHDVTGDTPENSFDEEEFSYDRLLDIYSVYFEMFYYMKLVPMGFVSGDREDFSQEEIKSRYPIISNKYDKTDDTGEHVLLLNPDDGYRPENGQTDENGDPVWSVYLLGNPSLEDLEE